MSDPPKPKNATTAIGYFWKAREMLTPTLKTSAFLEKGVLNPEEFVRAGDELVYRCPTWSWVGGTNQSYLPADKQYLITRNVPCRDRVATLEQNMDVRRAFDSNEDGDDEDNDWMVSNLPAQQQKQAIDDDDDFAVLDEDGEVVVPPPAPPSTEASVENEAGNDEYADMADYEDDNVLMDDDAIVTTPSSALKFAGDPDDHIVRVRTYDLSITYDNYYRTPRIWMTGVSAAGDPLSAAETMQDVMTDYANKTVTMEAHPHLPGPHASIHPCKHAKVMKTIVRNLIAMTSATDGNEGPAVEMYLFIFLKFVSSIIPTINYDFTMDVTANTTK
jgi:ubiquitin-like-conjugating enzyme ATG3